MGDPVERNCYVGGPVERNCYVGGPVDRNCYVGGPSEQNCYVGGPVERNCYVGGSVERNCYVGNPGGKSRREAPAGSPVERNCYVGSPGRVSQGGPKGAEAPVNSFQNVIEVFFVSPHIYIYIYIYHLRCSRKQLPSLPDRQLEAHPSLALRAGSPDLGAWPCNAQLLARQWARPCVLPCSAWARGPAFGLLDLGLWSLVCGLGPRSLFCGPWSLVPVPWSLVPSPWSVVPGLWSLFADPWSLVQAPIPRPT
jgi:hypothetical protein